MLYKGIAITEASGKIDGAVASRNRGTEYFRALGPGPGTPTVAQLYIQAAVTTCNTRWHAAAQTDRDAWELYARTKRRTDRLARRYPRTGWNEYLRWAVPRLQCLSVLGVALPAGALAANAPSGEYANDRTVVGNLTSGLASIKFSFDTSLPWCATSNDGMLFYCSAIIPATRNRAYGGYNLLGVAHNSGSPPTSPIAVTLPVAPTSGQSVFYRYFWTSKTQGAPTPMYGRAICP